MRHNILYIRSVTLDYMAQFFPYQQCNEWTKHYVIV